MKLTDVITGLRGINPDLQKEAEALEMLLRGLSESAEDAAACRTDRGRSLLATDIRATAFQALAQYAKVMQKVRDVDALTKGYTRTLAAEGGRKKPEADDNQPTLPGLEPQPGEQS